MLLPTLIGVGNDVPSIYLSQTTPSEATITFDVNGGNAVACQETVKNLLSSLPPPTYTGYEFVDWYLESSLITQVTTSTEFKVDSTIYAKWLKTHYVK